MIVNLSPADLPKAGAAYDFPIALAIVAAASDVPIDFSRFVAVGELSLRGEVRPVRTLMAAIEISFEQLLLLSFHGYCVLPTWVAFSDYA